ncbi:MAG: hypothetical protein JWR19_1118 [Pedosphaera sp.]|nr:hypothetical protein [Pedosphaera sp.]
MGGGFLVFAIGAVWGLRLLYRGMRGDITETVGLVGGLSLQLFWGAGWQEGKNSTITLTAPFTLYLPLQRLTIFLPWLGRFSGMPENAGLRTYSN